MWFGKMCQLGYPLVRYTVYFYLSITEFSHPHPLSYRFDFFGNFASTHGMGALAGL